jgi:hypothetical protein
LTSTSISAGFNERSLRIWAEPPSANHGGIFFDTTAVLIARAHGRVDSYVWNAIGAIWPGRWHVSQFFCRSGATSL